MKRQFNSFFAFCISIISITSCIQAQKTTTDGLSKAKEKVVKSLDLQMTKYGEASQTIWAYAEVGYQEEKSSKLLQDILTEEGFEVQSGVADIPTAFMATYGTGSPVIALLAEFDALPGVSQDRVAERKEVAGRPAGHACGHHLFGVGSAAAGISIKNWLVESGHSGTVRVYGTPAEEGGGGKIYMVRAGLFENVDAVLHWHPSSGNSADAASSLANKSAKFRFRGVASHAAGAPQNGRSALDGVEAMNHMTNMLREHVEAESRIHYVITSGGEAPNVVPEFAEVFYYCRHPEMQMVQENFERIVKAAEGAAMGTGTTMDYEVIHGLYNVMPNEALAKIMHKNLSIVGGIEYTSEESEFAQRIQTTLIGDKPPLESANKVNPFKVVNRGRGGSTDVGDVSWVVPTAGLRTATWVPGTSAHSWQAVAAGGTSIGVKGMMIAAKTLALTGIELIENPTNIQAGKLELETRRGKDFVYKSLVGDRSPPLDYRN